MSNALYRFANASFNPQQVVLLTAAFEKAWADVAGNFGPDQVPAARDRLARAIIAAAPAWPHTADTLAAAGIKELQTRYLGIDRSRAPNPAAELRHQSAHPTGLPALHVRRA